MVYRSEALVVASHGPLLLATWVRPGGSGTNTVAPLHQAARELARAHPAGIAVVALVGQVGGAIGEDARGAALAFLKDASLPLKAVAVISGGSGLRATVLRSFLTGLSLLSGSPAAVRFFATEAEADAWLAGAGPAGMAPGVTAGALAAFKAALAG